MNFLLNCGIMMPQLLKGLLVTLKFFAMTIVLALPLGLLVSLGRITKFKPIKWITGIYVWVMRGTPLLLQLFFVYYGLSMLGILKLEDFQAGLLAFTLNYAAYFAEIFRAGIQSIDKGQHEASKALGFGYGKTMLYIIIPQMIKRTLPPVTNETTNLVKDTALVAVIAIEDLLSNAKSIVSHTGDVTAYLLAAIIYLIIMLVLTIIFKRIEKHFNISDGDQLLAN